MNSPESPVSPSPSFDTGEPGVFSEHGPWRIDLAALRWRHGLDAVRAASRAEVPELVRKRTFPPLARFSSG